MDNNAEILDIYLKDVLIGYLSHFRDGKNVFVFDRSYIERGTARPIVSLSFGDRELDETHASRINCHLFFPIYYPREFCEN